MHKFFFLSFISLFSVAILAEDSLIQRYREGATDLLMDLHKKKHAAEVFLENPIENSIIQAAGGREVPHNSESFNSQKKINQTTLSEHEIAELIKDPAAIDKLSETLLFNPPSMTATANKKMSAMSAAYGNGNCRYRAQLENTLAQKKLKEYLKKYLNLTETLPSLEKQIAGYPDSNFELKEREENYKTADANLKDYYQEYFNGLGGRDRFKPQIDTYEKFKSVFVDGKGIRGADFVNLLADVQAFKESENFHNYDFAKQNHFPFKEGADRSHAERVKRLPKVKKALKELLADPYMVNILKKRKFTKEEMQKIVDTPDQIAPRNIVVSFEGTGGYSPIKEKRLKTLNALAGYHASDNTKRMIHKFLEDSAADKVPIQGGDTWSGLIYGPIGTTITQVKVDDFKKLGYDKDSHNLRDAQWIYMPSEVQGESREIAMDCLKKYLADLKHNKLPTPEITVIGHSSGGYSALRFIEELEKAKVSTNANLLTIDPVVPATIAGLKILPGKLDQVLNDPKCSEDRAFQSDQEDLKVNVQNGHNRSFLNFYQTEDTMGLNDNEWLRYGLHGNKVQNMDSNTYIYFGAKKNAKGVISTHGVITGHEKVLKGFMSIVHRY